MLVLSVDGRSPGVLMIATVEPVLAQEISAHRPFLYRLALLQLRDPSSAEDATQEALMAALEGAHRFEGRSSLRTWLVSILRYKVIDSLRNMARCPPNLQPDEYEGDPLDVLFDERGQWLQPITNWGDPGQAAERNEFMRVLEACLTRLPERSARAFLMREWLELDPKDVCEKLEIKAGNLRVLLYRARMQLRLCLDHTWN